VSRPSQAAAQAALDDSSHVASTIALNDQAKAILEAGLTDLDLDFIPSQTNFMMFDTGGSAASIASELSALGYQVRTGWGMPQHIRISTGLVNEMEGFLAALASILATGIRDESIRPTSLAVTAAYPNPFNAVCRVRLSVPTAEPVALSIYDLAGRKVRVLVKGRLGAGDHDLSWDGRDYAGRAVASGTYVLNLIQGEYATTRRLSLVK
jgi:hypothetical protein